MISKRLPAHIFFHFLDLLISHFLFPPGTPTQKGIFRFEETATPVISYVTASNLIPSILHSITAPCLTLLS